MPISTTSAFDWRGGNRYAGTRRVGTGYDPRMAPTIGITGEEQRLDNYRARIEELDAAVVELRPGNDFPLAELDGVVFSGGIDVAPDLYGEAGNPHNDEPSPARDATSSCSTPPPPSSPAARPPTSATASPSPPTPSIPAAPPASWTP